MTETYDVWIFHKRKMIEVTDFPGVPVELTSYVSEEAKQAAEARGNPTISEIGFERDVYLGPFETFDLACDAAEAKAKELGYTVEHHLYGDEGYDEDMDDDDDYPYDDGDWDDDDDPWDEEF